MAQHIVHPVIRPSPSFQSASELPVVYLVLLQVNIVVLVHRLSIFSTSTQGALKASGVAGIGPAVVDGEGGAVDGEGGASGGVKATCGDSDPVTSVALVVCIQVVANEISKAISNESSYESHI